MRCPHYATNRSSRTDSRREPLGLILIRRSATKTPCGLSKQKGSQRAAGWPWLGLTGCEKVGRAGRNEAERFVAWGQASGLVPIGWASSQRRCKKELRDGVAEVGSHRGERQAGGHAPREANSRSVWEKREEGQVVRAAAVASRTRRAKVERVVQESARKARALARGWP